MHLRQIRIGTKLEIETYDDSGQKSRKIFISQFESLKDGDVICIYSPIYQGRVYELQLGTIVDICFENDGNMYLMQGRVRTVDQEEQIALHEIFITRYPERIQQRAFYRFICTLGIKYRIFESLFIDKSDRGDFKTGQTIDISGGGICIRMDQPPILGDYSECIMELGKEIKFLAQVVRIITVRDAGKVYYEAGLEYKRISNRDRECVIGYIYESQRKKIQKGWSKI